MFPFFVRCSGTVAIWIDQRRRCMYKTGNENNVLNIIDIILYLYITKTKTKWKTS